MIATVSTPEAVAIIAAILVVGWLFTLAAAWFHRERGYHDEPRRFDATVRGSWHGPVRTEIDRRKGARR